MCVYPPVYFIGYIYHVEWHNPMSGNYGPESPRPRVFPGGPVWGTIYLNICALLSEIRWLVGDMSRINALDEFHGLNP